MTKNELIKQNIELSDEQLEKVSGGQKGTNGVILVVGMDIPKSDIDINDSDIFNTKHQE